MINILKLHEGLINVESSLAIQLRMNINSLDTVLFQVRVTSVSLTLYCYGRGLQMVTQVINLCPQYSRAQHKLRDELGQLPDFSRLLGNADRL